MYMCTLASYHGSTVLLCACGFFFIAGAPYNGTLRAYLESRCTVHVYTCTAVLEYDTGIAIEYVVCALYSPAKKKKRCLSKRNASLTAAAGKSFALIFKALALQLTVVSLCVSC